MSTSFAPACLLEARGGSIFQSESISNFTENVATLNGLNIIPFPLYPGFRSVEFSANDMVAQVAQPFTQQMQTQAWPGGDWWEGTITLPKMTRNVASQWIAFLMALRGTTNCFLIGDPFMKTPQGTPRGVPVANTSSTTNQAMAISLVTSGWFPFSNRNLLPGDYIQIGYRMHTVLNVVNADSAGNATISIWPSLRESPTTGTPIKTSNAQGLFRLASNKRQWSVDDTRLFGLSFKIAEAK